MENFPRRSRLDLNTPAELSIHKAITEVENVGADERLTKAVILLGEAKDFLSNYVDEQLKLEEAETNNS